MQAGRSTFYYLRSTHHTTSQEESRIAHIDFFLGDRKSMEKGLDWAVHKISKTSPENSSENTPQSASSPADGAKPIPTKARESEWQTVGKPGSLQEQNAAAGQAAVQQNSSGYEHGQPWAAV